MDFRYQKHFKAERGEKGRNKSMHGANAEDMIVRIPPGTTIIDDDTQEVIADLTRHGQEVVVAKGGRGGRGNTRFATARVTAPEIAENGEEGVERWVVLEMKVMADVGLSRLPKRWEIYAIVGCFCREAENCSVSLYNPYPEPRGC